MVSVRWGVVAWVMVAVAGCGQAEIGSGVGVDAGTEVSSVDGSDEAIPRADLSSTDLVDLGRWDLDSRPYETGDDAPGELMHGDGASDLPDNYDGGEGDLDILDDLDGFDHGSGELDSFYDLGGQEDGLDAVEVSDWSDSDGATVDAGGDVSEPLWDNSLYPPAGEPFPIVGYGAETKGGWQEGYDLYHVVSLADSGPGTLREALNSGGAPRVVLFDVDGVISLSAPLIVPSNITIDGRGRNIIIKNKGFVVPGSDEVIFINLALEDVGPDSEDGFQIGSAAPDPSVNVVLDHIRLTQHGDLGNAKKVDEAISIIFGSRNITIAWLRVESWEKVLLAGNGDAAASLDSQITLTWHHSYAYYTGRRHPQARYGDYHLFNNFWDDWHMYGSPILKPYPESFGSQIQDNGRMRLERIMVRRHEHGLNDTLSTANQASRCESGGTLTELGTWVLPDSTAPLKFGVGCSGAISYLPPYQVQAEEAGPALRDKLLLMTGNTLQ